MNLIDHDMLLLSQEILKDLVNHCALMIIQFILLNLFHFFNSIRLATFSPILDGLSYVNELHCCCHVTQLILLLFLCFLLEVTQLFVFLGRVRCPITESH